MKYRLAQNTISNNDIDALANWLKTYPPLTMPAGTLVKRFEEEWSKKTGVKYSVFCNSGSSANLLAYSALLNMYALNQFSTYLSAAGWSTTLSPLIQLGFKPVLIEVNKDTFGINLDELEKYLIRNYPQLVVLVHTLGIPNNMEEVLKLQKEYGFLLMEDSCPAVGSKYKNKYTGTFGDIGTFSFYYGHQISTIEGGMVCTNRKDIYEQLLMLRSHGWSKDLESEKRTKLENQWNIHKYQSDFIFYTTGYNLRPTEINAFLGLRQLRRLDEIVSKRDKRFWYYHLKLKDKFIVPSPPDDREISCITFPCIASSVEERKKVEKLLKENGIETRPISGGSLGQQPVWKEFIDSLNGTSFEFADSLHSKGFVLPCHPEVTFEDIDFICDLLVKNI